MNNKIAALITELDANIRAESSVETRRRLIALTEIVEHIGLGLDNANDGDKFDSLMNSIENIVKDYRC